VKRALILLILSGLGCGGQAFEAAFVENEQPEFSRVMTAIREAPARQDRAVIAYITGDPMRLVVYDVAAGAPFFSAEVDAVSAPVIAGNLVIIQETRGVVARHIESGAEAFVIDDEETRFVGADSDGDFTVVALAQGPEESPRGHIVGARHGDVLWDHDLQLPVGVPAVSGGIVIVPWATQRVSFLDAMDGHERTRVRIRDAVVGQALVSGGNTYVGQHGIFQVNEALEAGTRTSAAYYEPQARPLPAQPSMMRDGYAPVPPPDHAHHRVRLVWQVDGEGDEMGPRDGRVYFVFYRFLFAFDADGEDLAWVYGHDSDIAGAASVPGGVTLVMQDGSAVSLRAEDGSQTWSASLGEPIEVAVLRTGTIEAPDAAEAPEETSLADRLYAIARTDDARLAAGRGLAARYLGRIEGPAVTGQLVTLCADREEPEPVRLEACGALAERTEGSQHVRVALRGRASFLSGDAAPPVGALARAAATMNIRTVVPDLLAHLEDPATPSAELPGLLEGLGALGVRSAARPVEEFLRLYHASGDDPALVSALGKAAHALALLRGDHSVEVLSKVVADPFTPDPVRAEARAAITQLSAPPEQEAEEAAGATGEAAEEEEAEEEEADTRPSHITTAMTEELLGRAQHDLQACLVGDTPSARVAILVRPDGSIARVQVTPPSMQECVAPIILGHRFPATRRTRPEQIIYTLRRAD